MDRVQVFAIAVMIAISVMIIVNTFVNPGVMAYMMVSTLGLAGLGLFFAWLFD
jgi:hypothetical protein